MVSASVGTGHSHEHVRIWVYTCSRGRFAEEESRHRTSISSSNEPNEERLEREEDTYKGAARLRMSWATIVLSVCGGRARVGERMRYAFSLQRKTLEQGLGIEQAERIKYSLPLVAEESLQHDARHTHTHRSPRS